jgi:predicted dienelactone hydrolase
MTTPSVGCRVMAVADKMQDASIPLRVLYPTSAIETPERIGPYVVNVAFDADVAGNRLPLIVISHGTGGSALVYRDLALHLARSGFVVALPEHPGNNRDDNSLVNTFANLENRPRHIRLVIDAVLSHSAFAGRLSENVGLIGHSMGGYTSLALVGGRPMASPNETEDGKPRPVPVTRDPRVRAVVLLAPAVGWYMWKDALTDVDLPIMVRMGERDEYLPVIHSEIIKQGFRDQQLLNFSVIPGAGHFAFLTPFPPEMARPGFPPAQDPEGFDRTKYHPHMNAEILGFLRKHL